MVLLLQIATCTSVIALQPLNTVTNYACNLKSKFNSAGVLSVAKPKLTPSISLQCTYVSAPRSTHVSGHDGGVLRVGGDALGELGVTARVGQVVDGARGRVLGLADLTLDLRDLAQRVLRVVLAALHQLVEVCAARKHTQTRDVT